MTHQTDLQQALSKARHATRLLAWAETTRMETASTPAEYRRDEEAAWQAVDALIQAIFAHA